LTKEFELLGIPVAEPLPLLVASFWISGEEKLMGVTPSAIPVVPPPVPPPPTVVGAAVTGVPAPVVVVVPPPVVVVVVA
jgi:hypothetical protein